MEYFQDLRMQCRTGEYNRHSAALKYFRIYGEDAGVESVPFDNTEDSLVSRIVHVHGIHGTSFHFVGEPTIPWKWQEMVCQLDDDSLEFVVTGQDIGNRSRGLVSCWLQKTDLYDHKRHHAIGPRPRSFEGAELLKQWDFVLLRDNGTQVFIHPSWKGNKVECRIGMPQQDHRVPMSGVGGTSGPGTFKYFKNKQVERTLRFDARKILQGEHRTQGGQHRSRGARARCTSWTDVSHAPGEVL
jgi:hypothetical protein